MCLLTLKDVRKKCEEGRKAEIKGKMSATLAGRPNSYRLGPARAFQIF